MKKIVRNYQKITEKKRLKKTKRYDIKNFLTIYFLTKTTQKCANFLHILIVIHFLFFLLAFHKGTVQ